MAELGSFEKLGENKGVLRFVRRLAHPRERVWRAITEPEHLKAWFPSTIDGERKTGAAITLVFPDNMAPPANGAILAYEPPRLFEFTWGEDTLRFELQPDGDGTLLTLTNTIVEIGKAARDGAGWQVCLDALELDLDGKGGREALGRWAEFSEQYKERFGPEASTIGPPESVAKRR
jgi:uncharacterized protein YndB with AHSA1/START domain